MKKIVSIFILLCFLFTGQVGPCPVYAQEFRLPAPGVMVHLSPEFNPPILKGIKVHPDNPFRFDFILDQGDSSLSSPTVSSGVIASEAKQSQQEQLKTEATRLLKYFLASLTIPEKDLWVNLSPYEKDRIIPQSFGLTEMGRDLLAEDYMLKQITASLIYPEDEIGKKFWKRVYEQAAKKFGTTNIPVNTFNKVWIVPEKAVVYENAKAGTAYVVESKLKVMLEQDYLSMSKHADGGVAERGASPASAGFQRNAGEEAVVTAKQSNREYGQDPDINKLGSDMVREIVIPELTKEVNEDKNFAQLRQVYNSLILATWYKKKIKNSLLEQVYADKNKVDGVNIDDPQEKEKIYQRYLQAFKKGVFNYIKEEVISIPGMPSKEQGIFPRKYFSGGVTAMNIDQAMTTVDVIDPAQLNARHLEEVTANFVDLENYLQPKQIAEKGHSAQLGPDQAMTGAGNPKVELQIPTNLNLRSKNWIKPRIRQINRILNSNLLSLRERSAVLEAWEDLILRTQSQRTQKHSEFIKHIWIPWVSQNSVLFYYPVLQTIEFELRQKEINYLTVEVLFSLSPSEELMRQLLLLVVTTNNQGGFDDDLIETIHVLRHTFTNGSGLNSVDLLRKLIDDDDPRIRKAAWVALLRFYFRGSSIEQEVNTMADKGRYFLEIESALKHLMSFSTPWWIQRVKQNRKALEGQRHVRLYAKAVLDGWVDSAMTSRSGKTGDRTQYVTWEDLQREGYSFDSVYEDEEYQPIDPRNFDMHNIDKFRLIIELSKNGQEVLDSSIKFVIFPKQHVLYILDYHPNFPEAVIGRGRALLRQILISQGFFKGYHILGYANWSFRKSLQKIRSFHFEVEEESPLNLDTKEKFFRDLLGSDSFKGMSEEDRELLRVYIEVSTIHGIVPDHAMIASSGTADQAMTSSAKLSYQYKMLKEAMEGGVSSGFEMNSPSDKLRPQNLVEISPQRQPNAFGNLYVSYYLNEERMRQNIQLSQQQGDLDGQYELIRMINYFSGDKVDASTEKARKDLRESMAISNLNNVNDFTRSAIIGLQIANPKDKVVFVAGVGDGILAIVAVKLGAKKVIVTDISADALHLAKQNIANNGVEEKVIFKPAGDYRETSFNEDEIPDIIVANLPLGHQANLSYPIFKDSLILAGSAYVEHHVDPGTVFKKWIYVEGAISYTNYIVLSSVRDGIQWLDASAYVFKRTGGQNNLTPYPGGRIIGRESDEGVGVRYVKGYFEPDKEGGKRYVKGYFQYTPKSREPANDGAMLNSSSVSKENGGIDLTPANMNLQTQNAGEGIKFRMDPAMLQQLQNSPGFVPVIINIQPMTNLKIFLGINDSVGVDKSA